MTQTEIIEAIARQSFEVEAPKAKWDSQPESVKEAHRKFARQFWRNPIGLLRMTRAHYHRAMCAEVDLRRDLAEWEETA